MELGESSTAAATPGPEHSPGTSHAAGERMELATDGQRSDPLHAEQTKSATGETAETTRPTAKPFKYSNEARVYIARYEYLSEAHDLERYDECREGCMDMLMEPRIPRWTRIQVLQMLSTLLGPAGAEDCLTKAGKMMDRMDESKFQTRLLREDNNMMLADLNAWRQKNGHHGSLQGIGWDDVGGESVAESTELDHQLQQKLEEEKDEEKEPSEKLPIRTKDLDTGGSPGPASPNDY